MTFGGSIVGGLLPLVDGAGGQKRPEASAPPMALPGRRFAAWGFGGSLPPWAVDTLPKRAVRVTTR